MGSDASWSCDVWLSPGVTCLHVNKELCSSQYSFFRKIIIVKFQFDNDLSETCWTFSLWPSLIEYLEAVKRKRYLQQVLIKILCLQSGHTTSKLCLKIVSLEIKWCRVQDNKNQTWNILGNVRVVLFRECDRKGKKLLFDSSTVDKVRISPEKETKETAFTESTDGWGYTYLQPPSKDVR